MAKFLGPRRGSLAGGSLILAQLHTKAQLAGVARYARLAMSAQRIRLKYSALRWRNYRVKLSCI